MSLGRRSGRVVLLTPGQTNSALLANTLSLDKLSEFDGMEVRGVLEGFAFAAHRAQRPCDARRSRSPPLQSLKVIYSEDPAVLEAITELLLLHEQARSLGELTLSYSQTLAECAQGGQMFGESLNKLAYKRDPRTETLWETSWHALSLEQVVLRGGQQGTGAAAAPASSPSEGAPEGAVTPLPAGLSTIQQLLYTLGQGQLAAHARLMELAESSHMLVHKALDALKEQYRADVKGINDKYMESKRRWRYSLSPAVAHRHAPEEASRFESEAAAWRRQWEGASGELVEAARRVKNEHGPKVSALPLPEVVACAHLPGRSRRCWQPGCSCSSRASPRRAPTCSRRRTSKSS